MKSSNFGMVGRLKFFGSLSIMREINEIYDKLFLQTFGHLLLWAMHNE